MTITVETTAAILTNWVSLKQARLEEVTNISSAYNLTKAI